MRGIHGGNNLPSLPPVRQATRSLLVPTATGQIRSSAEQILSAAADGRREIRWTMRIMPAALFRVIGARLAMLRPHPLFTAPNHIRGYSLQAPQTSRKVTI